MKKFIEYLNEKFNKNENLNLIEYSFKSVPTSFIEYYSDYTKDKKVFWKPETLAIISHEKEVSQDEINSIQNDAKKIKKEFKHHPYTIEDVPNWYFDFYKNFKSLTLFRGSIILDKSIAQNTICIKPNCLDGKFYIGQYSGITPESCPIFTNQNGEIFVYDAKTFRNYPNQNNKKEIKEYLKQEVNLIAHWQNIEDFLIEECKRLEELFIINPTIKSIKNCNPKNV